MGGVATSTAAIPSAERIRRKLTTGSSWVSPETIESRAISLHGATSVQIQSEDVTE